MKKLITTTLAVTAVLFAAGASAEDRVLGESLDSGLGVLSSGYSAEEYNYAKKSDGSVEWPFAI